MNNPWLDISEADYVGHMNSPAVGQRPVRGGCWVTRLNCSTQYTARPGLLNGQRVGTCQPHRFTSRVVVVDVNPEYLRRLRERFPNPMFDLDVRCGDLNDVELEREE